MTQLFMREGRYIDAAALKRYNAGEDIFNKNNVEEGKPEANEENAASGLLGASNDTLEEGTVTPEGWAHYVTQEDLDNNEGFGEDVKVGDLIFVPLTDKEKAEFEAAQEAEKAKKAEEKAKKEAEKKAKAEAKKAAEKVKKDVKK